MPRPQLVSRRDLLRGGLTAAAGLWVGARLAGCRDPNESQLVFLNWQDYIDPTMLDGFSDRTGLAVVYETYASNDELEKRLNLASTSRRRGRQGSTFDLVVPSDNLLHRLRTLDLLQELDHTALSNLGNLDEAFRRQPFDPGNRFSLPWATGTTGIGYDTTVFAAPPGWEVFLDKTHAGKMTILDERREAFGLALFVLGEDPNTRDPAVISRAEAQLGRMKGVIRGFDSATYLDRLTAGELVCAHAYSTDVLQARERNPKLAYGVPRQGAFRWIDSLCIPTDAPNPRAAHSFLNYYLEPAVSASNAVASKVDTGNAAARAFVPRGILDDPAIFPTPEVVTRLAFVKDLGDEEELYEQAWERLKKP